MDINHLFTDDGLRAATSQWRDDELKIGGQYGQLARVFEARIKAQAIDGDHWWSARLRARRVARHLKSMQKACEKAAASAESLYGDFVNQVVELPERREKALVRKEAREERRALAKGTASGAVAQSLTNSIQGFTGTPQTGNPQVTAAQQTPQYVPPMPFQYTPANSRPEPVGNILDQFPEAL